MMTSIKFTLASIILIFNAACQQTLVAVDSSPAPSETPLPQSTPRPTLTPGQIDLPTPTYMPTQPPFVPASTIPSVTLGAQTPLQSPPVNNNLPGATPTIAAAVTLIPAENTFSIGKSVQGRDILAWRFGTGDQIVLLVGGIHAGFEANTVMLINEMIAHFQGTPTDILPGITLLLVPVANPDGLVLGRESQGRFNANHVDLNRNWGCDWSTQAYWQSQLVNPGERAFSEPETRAVAGLIRDLRPSAAIFYHAAAHGVFAGDCDGDHGSAALAAVIGEASGYPYGKAWSAYPVSGTASTWADGLGVPAVDLELSGTRETEFIPNLQGVIAVQKWLTGAS
ncbi:MAG: M14 family zinc carboxypeptidase [Chloroflexota bacterium]